MLERWKTYVASISSLRNCRHYSPLWQTLINDFRFDVTHITSLERFIQEHSRGYSYVGSNSLFSAMHVWLQILAGGCAHYVNSLGSWIAHYPMTKLAYFAALSAERVLHRRYHRSRIYDWRLFMLWNYLRHSSIDANKYLESFPKEKRPKPDYNTLKTVYFLDKVLKNCAFKVGNKLSVVEIGAGAANFAVLMSNYFARMNYYIVDLPEMLLVASHELKKYVPQARQILPNEVRSGLCLEHGITNFVLLTPEQTRFVPKGEIDFVLNIESFGEMEQDVANRYINLAYEWLQVGGYFLVANRESREIKSGTDELQVTTFWRYPFRQDDEVIIMEYCPMRDYLTGRRTRNINRLSRKQAISVHYRHAPDCK